MRHVPIRRVWLDTCIWVIRLSPHDNGPAGGLDADVDPGFALRGTPVVEIARFRDYGHTHPGDRDRREYRRVQHHGCGDLPSTGGSGSEARGGHLRAEESWRQPIGSTCRLGRLAAAEPFV